MAAMELVEGDAIDSAPPVEAPKATPKPTPYPELKPPVKPVKGKVDPIPPQHVEPPDWTMLIDAPDDATWVDEMVRLNDLKIKMANSAEQLKEMFQINKAHYDKLKVLNPSVYADVIDKFTNAKRSFF